MNPNFQLPSTKALISTAASVAATAMLVRSFARDFIPSEIRHYFITKFHQFLTIFSNEATLVIDEYDGLNKNQLFYAAELYLGTIMSPSTTRFRASLPEKENKIRVSWGGHEEITDKFCGLQLRWRLVIKSTHRKRVAYSDDYRSTTGSESRYFELTFHKKQRNKVVDEYLLYVLERSKAIGEEKKTLKLHTLKNDRPSWQSVNLDHPANFDTLAMDDEIKNMIIDDLERFVKRKEFYEKVGKAWKRGYLLFGPPGTGKSSLIAAIANHLNFDIYDIELTDLRRNSDLRRLLISIANRSILVVEDIDASIDLPERKKEAEKPHPRLNPFRHDQEPMVTLSGLLNFMDGLWSSCGDERIIIFTTNHKDKLDPALLRPGRLDVHIHMSYCTPRGFKILVSNYLGITEHPLVLEAEEMIASSKVTPAEVGEQLLKTDDPEHALQGLINFLQHKKEGERDGEGNPGESEKVVVMTEKVEEETTKLKISQSPGGLTELIKAAKACPAEMSEKILKKDEAANALKILIRFLEEESGGGNTKDSDKGLGSSVESGKEDGIKRL